MQGEQAALPAFAKDAKMRFTESPNPTFSYGQTVAETDGWSSWKEGESAGWKYVDTATEDPGWYPLMISGIVPRPIAFVSSVSTDGTENLAPFSWFNMVTHNPPLVSISVSVAPSGSHKDTAANIKATKEFTVNIISEPFVENANITCIDAPAGISEWPLSGLTKEPSVHVKPARVKESAFSMECELFQANDIIHPVSGKHTTTLILGHVKAIHVRADVLNERGIVDITKFKPISRLGDISYARVGDAFRLPRQMWKLEGEKVQKFLKTLGDA
ncbi:hypothetical protein C8Q80DRAFT_1115495 [Daedaleopsis nitida]|nr:hypothetical protein C8Q80DRAFT_1115495 [Daedaleopsis nitida]